MPSVGALKGQPPGARTFRGGVLDTGAPTTVIGVKEARLYAEEMGIRLSSRSNQAGRIFRFGIHPCKAIGSIIILLPVGSVNVQVEVPIVAIDIPLLLGLDLMSTYDITLKPASREAFVNGEVIVLCHDGHLLWPRAHSVTYYTQNQIRKLHRHFIHPSAQKFSNLLSTSSPENMTPETRAMIYEITANCQTCQEISRRPLRFSVRSSDDVIFNQHFLLDIMYIHGSVFMSDLWRGMSKASDISLKHTGVESHNSLHAGETLHHPLQRTYEKILIDHPDVDVDLALALATKK
jgi:hypothetical protein